MEQHYVPFHKSMTADKRAADFCYLRHNILDSRAKGMYPSKDFVAQPVNPTFPLATGERYVKTVGQFIFTNEPANNQFHVYRIVSSQIEKLRTESLKLFIDAVETSTGALVLCDNGDLGNLTSSSFSVIHTFSSVDSRSHILYDGLYNFYFIGKKIFRQLGTGTPTEVFGDLGNYPIASDIYGDQIAIFFDAGNKHIQMALWGKDSSTEVDKRITIKNSVFLAGGNVDGTLMLVKSIGRNTNSKELEGEIVITAYDGEKFQYRNSIETGNPDLTQGLQSISDEEMVFSIGGNSESSNAELNRNWVYKVRANGSIETLFEQGTGNQVTAIDVLYDHLSIATMADDGSSAEYRLNEDNDSDFDAFSNFTDSKYITNMLEYSIERKKFGGIGFSFEKLFGTTEELTVSYRTSDRDDWIVIDTITATKIKNNTNNRRDQSVIDADFADGDIGLDNQVYELKKMPDGSSFMDFYEIQFKIESKYGLSVIDFWYYSEPIKRG